MLVALVSVLWAYRCLSEDNGNVFCGQRSPCPNLFLRRIKKSASSCQGRNIDGWPSTWRCTQALQRDVPLGQFFPREAVDSWAGQTLFCCLQCKSLFTGSDLCRDKEKQTTVWTTDCWSADILYPARMNKYTTCKTATNYYFLVFVHRPFALYSSCI